MFEKAASIYLPQIKKAECPTKKCEEIFKTFLLPHPISYNAPSKNTNIFSK